MTSRSRPSATGAVSWRTELPSAFDTDTFQRLFPPGIERDFWHTARCAMVEAALRRHGLAGGRVLDIGCGRGIMVAHLRQAGIDARGCEPSPQAPIPPDLFPWIARRTSLEELPRAEREQVRGALLLDVLEHLEHPAELLQDVADLLPALEGLVVTVPARMELWTRYDALIGHWRRYDLTSLRAHLLQGGFEPLEAGYMFHGLYPALRALTALGRSRSERFQAPRGAAWLTFHAVVGAAFRLEHRLLPAGVPGSSLLAVARPARG